VVLDPGDALFLAPGVLHAYLHGAGVEVQASSDNVVRGGLTPKHVDVSALLDVVVYDDGPPPHVRPRPVAPGVDAYDVPVPDFAVWRVRPKGEERDLPGAGPRVVVCVEGSVTVDGLPIAQGRAAYVDVERGEGDADREDVAEPRVGGDGTCFVVAPGR
jgi:mannose-6-phosphate isomerase